MTNRILVLLLDGQTSPWDVSPPPEWYLDRARDAQAEREQHGPWPLDAHRHVVRAAQRIINEAPRDD